MTKLMISASCVVTAFVPLTALFAKPPADETIFVPIRAHGTRFVEIERRRRLSVTCCKPKHRQICDCASLKLFYGRNQY
ncbi:hypothetical protein TNCV_3239341 [Trichonephila clavipes]|nr:hypothetical protein TNCV_3239341 [Trichonephila clavipes]